MKKPFILLLMLPVLAMGQQFRYGPAVTIDKPVYEDLYIAAGKIIINAPIHGDLVLAGGTVTINDSVTNDILVTGGEITFNGYVGDDIRCAGGRLAVEKNVAGDLIISGGNVAVNRAAVISGSLLAGGGDVLLNGTVKGYVKSGAGKLKINGLIEQDLNVKGGELVINGTINGKSTLAAQKILIGPDAAFMQDVRYWNRKGRADFGGSVKNGRAVFDQSLRIASPRWQYLGFASFLALLWYLSAVLIFILVIRYLFGKPLQKAGETLTGNIPRHIGFGLLFLVLVPIAIAMICATIIGIPLGLLAAVLYFVIIMLSLIISAIVITNWYNTRYERRWSSRNQVWATLVLFVALKLISLVPFIGWVLSGLTVCLVFGAVIDNIKWRPYTIQHKSFAA